MKSKRELLEKQRRLQEVYPEVRRELMQILGVVKVGIGIKETDGDLTGDVVFRVYVEEKKAPGEIPPGQMIPSEIRGFKTDVVIVRPEYPEADTEKYRPVKAGVQVNRADSGEVGTLGCFAHLVSDDSVVLLSNHHVLYGDSGADDTEIGQPLWEKSCCCTCNDVAANVHAINRAHLDCAIARLKSGVAHDARIEGIGFITDVADAVVGDIVRKRGRTTLLTEGEVTDIEFDADTGNRILEIEVRTDNGQERFSRGGDSGSALLNEDDEIVGLHKSGNNRDDVAPGDFFSTSIGIQEVLDALEADGFEITIITGEGDDEAAERVLEMPRGMTDALWALELRLKETVAGRELWSVVQRHQKEAVRLVNKERPVMVVWHRSQGPTFLAALGRSLKEPGYRIPDAIEGVTRRQAATAILSALDQHGSEPLRADLARFSPALLDNILQSDSVEEILRAYEETAVAECAALSLT